MKKLVLVGKIVNVDSYLKELKKTLPCNVTILELIKLLQCSKMDYSNVKFLLGKEYSVSDIALLDFDFEDYSNSNIVDMFASGRKLGADMVDNCKLMPYQLYYFEHDSHTSDDHSQFADMPYPYYYYTISETGEYDFSICTYRVVIVLLMLFQICNL